MSRYPTFREMMADDGCAHQELLVMAIATITGTPGQTDKTPEEVYDQLTEMGTVVYGTVAKIFPEPAPGEQN